MAAAVGICLAAACEQGVVQEATLSAAGLRVRRVTSGAADLIVCKGGSTLAFMLWSEGSDSDCAARAPRLAAAARHAHVLVPHALMESPAAVDAASRWARAGSAGRAKSPLLGATVHPAPLCR